jgi:hypothetical protein
MGSQLPRELTWHDDETNKARFLPAFFSGVFVLMAKRRLITLAVTVLATSLVGQVEHAPTVAQCQADQRLWIDEIENRGTHLKYVTIDGWLLEMGDCDKVDPKNHSNYHSTEAEIVAEEALRMEGFIQRHSLWNKFIAEDSAGTR